MLSRKLTMFASTTTVGRISVGNSDLVTSELPPTMALVPSFSEDANHCHGSRPASKNSA